MRQLLGGNRWRLADHRVFTMDDEQKIGGASKGERHACGDALRSHLLASANLRSILLSRTFPRTNMASPSSLHDALRRAFDYEQTRAIVEFESFKERASNRKAHAKQATGSGGGGTPLNADQTERVNARSNITRFNTPGYLAKRPDGHAPRNSYRRAERYDDYACKMKPGYNDMNIQVLKPHDNNMDCDHCLHYGPVAKQCDFCRGYYCFICVEYLCDYTGFALTHEAVKRPAPKGFFLSTPWTTCSAYVVFAPSKVRSKLVQAAGLVTMAYI